MMVLRVTTMKMFQLMCSLAILLTLGQTVTAETLTDRCHSNVYIPPTYNSGRHTPGTVVLSRDTFPYGVWTREFVVGLSSSGYIRWYCASHKEKSRCNNRSTKIRAKIGSNRLLQMECLGKEPVPSAPPFPSTNEILLCNRWDCRGGTAHKIVLANYNPKSYNTLPSSIKDQCEFIMFNLAPSVVITLTDRAGSGGFDEVHKSHSISFWGEQGRRSVDGPHLIMRRMYSTIAGFTWYTYNTDMGRVDLFDNTKGDGGSKSLFLSAFNVNEVVDMRHWWMNDQADSLLWSVGDVISVTLYEDDGSGRTYEINGWSGTNSELNLNDVGMGDRISSFKWSFRTPKKEIILDHTMEFSVSQIIYQNTISKTSYRETGAGKQTVTVTVGQDVASKVSATVQNTETFGWEVKAEAKVGWDFFGAKVTTTLKGSTTTVETKDTTTETSVTSTIEDEIELLPYTNNKITTHVRFGRLPSRTDTLTATRWYDIPVPGGVKDPSNNNWYKREERLKLTIEGEVLYGESWVELETTYLRSPTTQPSPVPIAPPTLRPSLRPTPTPTTPNPTTLRPTPSPTTGSTVDISDSPSSSPETNIVSDVPSQQPATSTIHPSSNSEHSVLAPGAKCSSLVVEDGEEGMDADFSSFSFFVDDTIIRLEVNYHKRTIQSWNREYYYMPGETWDMIQVQNVTFFGVLRDTGKNGLFETTLYQSELTFLSSKSLVLEFPRSVLPGIDTKEVYGLTTPSGDRVPDSGASSDWVMNISCD